MAANKDNAAVVWKHIGLHGHSVGSFACDDRKIVWKSAITGRDDVDVSSSRTVPGDKLSGALWTVLGKTGHVRLQAQPGPSGSSQHLKHEYRLDGFPPGDFELLKNTLKSKYGIDLQTHQLSSAGTQYGLTAVKGKNLVFRHCVLDDMNEEGQEFEPRAEDEMMSIDLTEVSQAVLPGTNRNEIEIQFPESDTVEAGTDQLVSIRFYIPPDSGADAADKDAETPAELLQQKIMNTANIRKTTGDVICSFEQGTFLTPRGRYNIELYDYFVRLRGQKYDYKIKYDDINRLFLLPKPDEVHMAFVIALDKPIRQGQQRYQHLVLQVSKDPDEVQVNLDEDTLQKEYGGELQPLMRGSLSNLIAKTFKVIAQKKVFIPGKFANAAQQTCVKCAVRANEGLLYPLEKQFVFIHKPPILVRFNEIESVEFQRYAGGTGSTRNFDLQVNLKMSATAGQAKEYTFSGIDRSDYTGLYNFLSGKKIPIKNLQSSMDEHAAQPRGPVYNEDEIYGGPDEEGHDDELDSDDDDFDEDAAAENEEALRELDSDADSDLADEDLGSEVSDTLDSDLEEARHEAKKARQKKRAASGEDDEKSPKKRKMKDTNAPKKARSAYQLFANQVRAQIQQENPDAEFGTISTLISAQFKGLSEKERSKWDRKAEEDKNRFDAEMAEYSAPEDDLDGGKPLKKKVKKDANAPKRAKSAYMFFTKEQRSKIREESPGLDFGEVGKKLGEAWRNVNAEDKKRFEAMAERDKLRYTAEMANYEPSESASPTKRKKDKNEPKRATTAFLAFSTEVRSKVKSENPDLSFGELGKKVGELYKGLSASEKAKYEELASEDMERYKMEKTSYDAKKTSPAAEDSDVGSGSKSDEEAIASSPGQKKAAPPEESGSDEEEDSDDGDSEDSDDDSE